MANDSARKRDLIGGHPALIVVDMQARTFTVASAVRAMEFPRMGARRSRDGCAE